MTARNVGNGRFTSRDLTSQTVNNYTVLRDTGKRAFDGSHIWEARCMCGKVFEVPVSRMNRVKSCGCLSKTSFYSDNTREDSDDDTCDLPREEWRKVDGFSCYYISNKGRVKSTRYLGKEGKVRILKSSEDAKGYLRITLRADGDVKNCKIHRLVAEAFLDNPEGKTEVNHKDGNKKNNFVENLEWCTSHENIKHAYDNGLKENNRAFAKVLGNTKGKEVLAKYMEAHKTPVEATNIKTGEVFKFSSQTEAAQKLNLEQANICKVLCGKRKHTGGYRFVKVR